MKRLCSIIAIMIAVTAWLAVPVFATAVDVGGEMRARGYIIQGADFTKDENQNWLDARFRLNAKISQGMTTGVVQVDMLGNSLNGTNGNLIFGNDLGNSYNLVGVRQAYLAINFPVLTVIGGRYEVKLGNGLLLNDTSDLVAVTAPIGPVNLLLGYLALFENDSPFTPPIPAYPDGNAIALNAGMKNIGGSGFNGDLFVVLAQTNLAKGNNLKAYGISGDGKIGPANVGAELDLVGGDVSSSSSANYKGTNVLVTGGLPADSVGLPVGLTAAIIYASGVSATSTDVNAHSILGHGDFRASNILVRNDFNNYEGLGDIGEGSYGLEAVKVAANLPTMKGLGMSHTPEIGLVWAKTAEDVQVTSTKKSTDLGIEIYANTNCVVDPNLSANIGLGYVAAGDAAPVVSGSSGKKENQLKAEASLTFHF